MKRHYIYACVCVCTISSTTGVPPARTCPTCVTSYLHDTCLLTVSHELYLPLTCNYSDIPTECYATNEVSLSSNAVLMLFLRRKATTEVLLNSNVNIPYYKHTHVYTVPPDIGTPTLTLHFSP